MTKGTLFLLISYCSPYYFRVRLWLNDSELDSGSRGTGFEPCPRPSDDRLRGRHRIMPVSASFFCSCIIFLSSRCFIPVCPSCVQIAYSKFCVSVVSSIDSGLQDRILLPRTLKLFSASFHFHSTREANNFRHSLKFIFLFACNRDFYFENEA